MMMINNNDDEERSSPSLSTPNLNRQNKSQPLNSNPSGKVANSPTPNASQAGTSASAGATQEAGAASASAEAGGAAGTSAAGASSAGTGAGASAGGAAAGSGATASAGAGGASAGGAVATGAGAGFAPIILIVVALIAFVMFFAMIIDLIFPSTVLLSSNTETQGENMGNAMKDGYVEVFRKQSQNVVDKMNDIYNCGGTIDNIQNNEDGTMSYITDACEIHISFVPDIEKYQEEVTGYINSINGAIAFFNPSKMGEQDIELPEQSLTSVNENGPTLSEYAKEYKKTYSNEYTDSEGPDILNTARHSSNKIFQTDAVDEWGYDGFHQETRERQVQVSEEVCEYEKVTDSFGNIVRVCSRTDSRGNCLLYQDKIEKECHGETKYVTETYKVEVGDITIHMSYDIESYKKEEVEETINSLVGTYSYKQAVNNEFGTSIEKYQLDKTTAKELFNETVQNYYFNYMALYSKDEYGVGYAGSLTHFGTWNYKSYMEDIEISRANLFWAYSANKKSEIANISYKSDCYGGYPEFTHQCTQYAGTWFVDTFGFAAIRGGGVNVADNLIKDCNEEGACPVRFLRSNDVAPGAVVSFYPNHVAVVEEVKNDGTIMISHGNITYGGIAGRIEQYSPYSSIQEFAAKYKLQVKTIAIPKQGFEKGLERRN